MALLVLAGFVFSRLRAGFVPLLDEGSFATPMIRTTSIGIDASVAMQKRAEKVLLEKFPEVVYTFSRQGATHLPHAQTAQQMAEGQRQAPVKG